MQIKPEFIQCSPVEWTNSSGKPFSFKVARLDEIHPFISGNKYFKLKYNLKDALLLGKKGILTMGGAYSNHLAATAFACNEAGLNSAGIIRGKSVETLSPTLQFCMNNGMKLIHIERNAYNRNSAVVKEIQSANPELYFIPEGGDNEAGFNGCKEILSLIKEMSAFTHIVCCMGTGTTFKGIAAAALPHQTVIGIPVLKIKAEEKEQFIDQHATCTSTAQKIILFEYAGKGYAKWDEAQLDFMNSLYTKTGIPTDIVYTGKLMQAVIHLFETGYFTANDHVLVIHSGGLQGNNSLEPGQLFY